MNNRALFLKIITLLFLFFSSHFLNAQDPGDRLRRIERRLEALIETGLPLDEEITISFTGSIQELVTFLAESTELSVAIDPYIQQQVSVTFTAVMVRDIVLYLCDTYSLGLRPTGEIVYLVQYKPPPLPS
ncbi:MAG: hypothetical protein AAFU67_07375, partial [Bacteroidota bacterium]